MWDELCVEKSMAKVWKIVFIWHVDTTNIIERHWQFIKYTTLRVRINYSIIDLLHALIGDTLMGTYIGGTVIE